MEKVEVETQKLNFWETNHIHRYANHLTLFLNGYIITWMYTNPFTPSSPLLLDDRTD